MRPHLFGLAAVSTLLGACTLATWAPLSTCPASAGGPTSTVIGGQVRAPISLIDPTTKDAREVAVSGSDVGLADAKDQALPGLHATTSDTGSYAENKVVAGYAYQVVARVKTNTGRTVIMRGLAEPDAGGATSDINIATTILTMAVTEGLSGMLGHFDQGLYQRAVAMVYQHLVDEGSPDPEDKTTILGRVGGWEASDAAFKSAVETLRQQLSTGAPPLSEVLGKIAILAHQAVPGASPVVPTSVPASATPGPQATTPAPSESPSPDATPVTESSDVPPDAAPSSLYEPGFNEGPIGGARFNGLGGLAIGPASLVFAADALNNRIRQINFTDPTNPLVGTLTGKTQSGATNGALEDATFSSPRDVTFDGTRTLYVADTANNAVRAVDLVSRQVTTVAGGIQGNANTGGGQAGQLDQPTNLVYDGVRRRLYVSEPSKAVIRMIDLNAPNHPVTTLSGTYGQRGYRNSDAASSQFQGPTGLAMGPDNNLYVADAIAHVVRRLTFDPAGVPLSVERVAGIYTADDGNIVPNGQVDGLVSDGASFQQPTGLSFDRNGDLLVADPLNRRIRRIRLSSTPVAVDTVIGPTVQDYNGRTVALAAPSNIATDLHGTSYYSDLRLGLLLPLD